MPPQRSSRCCNQLQCRSFMTGDDLIDLNLCFNYVRQLTSDWHHLYSEAASMQTPTLTMWLFGHDYNFGHIFSMADL